MEEMKPVMKNEKKYKLGIGKKIVAALITLGLVLGIGVGLVACNKDPVDQDQNPGIEQPADPDDGKEDPDDGKEDPENPGDPTDPENPGEPEDPENPGEPEDPENPTDPENPEEPPIEDEKDPFVLDTFDELMQYRQNTLYNNLNENFLDGIIYRCTLSHNYSYEDATNIKWSILESSDTDISKAQVRFNLRRGETYSYYIGEVTFNEPISVQNFADEGKITQEMIENASSKRIYSANTIADQMEQNQALAKAIVTKLGGTLNDSDQFLPAMDNASTDPEYSWVRNITVSQITDTGVNEYGITINAANTTGSTIEAVLEQLQKNLEAGQYKNDSVEKVVEFEESAIDGTQADVEEPEFEEEAASTASETYRLYRKMKAKDGSSVHIYLPEDLMNELE